jgi:hypothetical protein
VTLGAWRDERRAGAVSEIVAVADHVADFRFIATVPSTLTINPPKDEKRADLTAKERQEDIARAPERGVYPLLFVSWRSSAAWRFKNSGAAGASPKL